MQAGDMGDLDLTTPFTAQAARAAGLSRRRLEASCTQLVRGIYVRSTGAPDILTHARAALLVAASPHAFVSHQLAARLYGAVVPSTSDLHVSVPPGTKRRRRDGVVVHSSARRSTIFRGVPVTLPAETFLDLARLLDLVELVVLGDSLVRRGRCSPAHLQSAAADFTGRGARRARRAAGLVRSGVDSPMETRSRMLRVLSGLPELETDIRFYDDSGRLRRRLDAGDRRTLTAVEYDGRHHVQREEQWEADLGRREQLEDEDWRIVTLISGHIYISPGTTVDRLRRIFRQRGIPVGPPRDEWRRFFPGRP